MELIITETDIREAIVDWLATKYKMHILPEHLEPLMKTEGTWEDTRHYQAGFKVLFEKTCKEPLE